MRAPIVLFILVVLATSCFGKEIHRGANAQVKPNSIWFKEEANLSHWQQLKKSGDTSALSSYQDDVLSQRDAWQFVHPLTVKILRYEAAKRRVKVEMKGEGRMAGTKWWLDVAALEP